MAEHPVVSNGSKVGVEAASYQLRRELGERLVAFRKAAGMTQAQLASAAYCGRTRIAHLEHGRGAADHRCWRTVDEVLSAGGLLVQTDRQVRAAQREHEAAQYRDELASLTDQTGGPRAVGTPLPTRATAVLHRERGLCSAMDWLDERAGWAAGTSRRRVADRLDDLRPSIVCGAPPRTQHTITRSRIARELARYYRSGDERCDIGMVVSRLQDVELQTSVISRPEWLDLGLALTSGRDCLVLQPARRRDLALSVKIA
jgi:transcriptional regulator with XRE-family HTH domain